MGIYVAKENINNAKNSLDSVIKEYKSAKLEITKGNSNNGTDKIINSINNEINDLEEIKTTIEKMQAKINTLINKELHEDK